MNRNRLLGFLILFLVALLLLWASVTGALADLFAALLTPAYLKETS